MLRKIQLALAALGFAGAIIGVIYLALKALSLHDIGKARLVRDMCSPRAKAPAYTDPIREAIDKSVSHLAELMEVMECDSDDQPVNEAAEAPASVDDNEKEPS